MRVVAVRPFRLRQRSICRLRAVAFSSTAVELTQHRDLSVPSSAGGAVVLSQHYFAGPVQQPRTGRKRVADLTGLKAWPCAQPLLGFLEQSVLPGLLAGRDGAPLRVLELGSGTGIVGLSLAAVLGPGSSVVLTDPGLDVNFSATETGNTMDRLRQNVTANAALLQGRASVSAAQLLWGDEDHIARIAEVHGRSFDLIVGSDLLYDPHHYPALVRTMAAFSRPDNKGGVGHSGVDSDGASPTPTLTVLGNPTRLTEGEKRFVTRAGEGGFGVESTSVEADTFRVAISLCRLLGSGSGSGSGSAC
jgi:hypothetical protein